MDPRSLGAKCDECPLNNRKPVSSAFGAFPKAIVLGEGPNNMEEIFNEPLHPQGESGKIITKLFEGVGIMRSRLVILNAFSCRANFNEKEDVKIAATECCKPRLINELRYVIQRRPLPILALGKYASVALTNNKEIMNHMGPVTKGKIDNLEFEYLSTFHPNFIAKQPSYSPVMLQHFYRYIDYLNNKLPPWDWKDELYLPDKNMLDVLKYIKAHPNEQIGTDSETDGLLDPITNRHKKEFGKLKLLNVGFSTTDISVSVPWNIVENDPEFAEIKALTIDIVANHPNQVYQNADYDLPVWYKILGIKPAMPKHDTLIASRILNPEWKAELGFRCAFEFHVERWKTIFKMLGDVAGKNMVKHL
ncbi:MAG: hypothetical protein HC877_18845 [Thioploca sp.]|nr:hypothetical protein [Thioploca sp.]